MSDVAIVDAIRTPFGKRGGSLASVHPADLLAFVLQKIKQRNHLEYVDDIIAGCALQSLDQSSNIARFSALIAGFPEEIPACSINRLCASSQEALHSACQAILSGDAEVIIACGVESMTRVPMDLSGQHRPSSLSKDITHQGLAAEAIAARWKLSRTQLDEFAMRSHELAAAAVNQGLYRKELVGCRFGATDLEQDEGIRFSSNTEKMASLKPAFKENGVITAGNSSQISDGAAAALLCSAAYAQKHNLPVLARIKARAVVGSDPVLMLTGTPAATAKVLKKAGLSAGDIDLFEVNEAFAAVVLAWQEETGIDLRQVNVHGGAIALGHPLGASGIRILATLLGALEQRDLKYGLMTMCIGYGQATATIVER